MSGAPLLVVGRTGQLGRALAAAGARVRGLGRDAIDFDRPETVGPGLAVAIAESRPSLVVNAAAWTAVDRAETEPAAAARANRDGPAALAAACARAGLPFLHVSTDYVFDGSKGAPYTEADPTSPTGVYGRTKRDGEQAVLAADPRAIVLRTSWVYAARGKNFVRTMLGAARKTDTLRVVGDQHGCPTAAEDLADAILGIADRLQGGWRDEYAGLFHAAGDGETTWHGLAVAAFEAASRHGRPMPKVIAITTAEWPTPTARPADSRLDCSRLEAVFGQRLPPWRASLDRVVDRMLAPDSEEPA